MSKSKYLQSAEDISVGDIVLYDDNEMDPCKVVWIGEIFARLESPDGDPKPFDIMRDRLKKIEQLTAALILRVAKKEKSQ